MDAHYEEIGIGRLFLSSLPLGGLGPILMTWAETALQSPSWEQKAKVEALVGRENLDAYEHAYAKEIKRRIWRAVWASLAVLIAISVAIVLAIFGRW